MGAFGWGDLIAVIAVLVSVGSVAVTVRTSRGAETAAMAAAKRQEHMARSFDRLVAAAERIADESGRRRTPAARTDDRSGPPTATGPQWQVENPSEGHFVLRNLSASTRHDVRIDQTGPGADDLPEGVTLTPLAGHDFELQPRPAGAPPGTVRVTDAEHPEPVEVPVERWF